jgi:branched-chain amino acid transport system permease protein
MAGLSINLVLLQLFAGLALGAIYVLFAIGLSLIFGMLTVVNFAHGAFYMVGA